MTLRAQLLYKLDKQPVDQILKVLVRTLSLDPDNAAARILLKKIKNWEAIKKAGNDAFGASDWNTAKEKYTEFLTLAEGVPRAKGLSNRANVFSKLGLYQESIIDATAALEALDTLLFPQNFKSNVTVAEQRHTAQCAFYVKLYLRRADCYMKLEQYEEAVRDYQALEEMRPMDRGLFLYTQ